MFVPDNSALRKSSFVFGMQAVSKPGSCNRAGDGPKIHGGPGQMGVFKRGGGLKTAAILTLLSSREAVLGRLGDRIRAEQPKLSSLVAF